MIGVILAAGRGSRLREISKNKPKSFINIFKQKKIIEYQISVLKKINVKKIIIVIGYKKEFFYKKFSKDKKITFVINKDWNKSNVLHSFYKVINYIDDDFIFVHADSIVDIRLYKMFLKSKNSTLPYKQKKKYPDEDMKLYLKNKKALLTKKNISNLKPKGEFLGIAYFKRNLVNEFKNKLQLLKKNKKYSSLFFEDLINKISKKYIIDIKNIGKLKYVEIDFPEDLIEAKKLFKKYLSKFFQI